MNQKRKAELQRKLSMAPVPRPPDGLAERIKSDIPDILNTQRERERFSKSVAFNVRVAASILLLVSSSFLMLHLLTSGNDREAPVATKSFIPAAPAAQSKDTQMLERGVEGKTAEVTVTMADRSFAFDALDERAPARRDQFAGAKEREEANEVAQKLENRPFEKSAGVVGGVISGVAVAAPPPPPAAAPAPAPEPALVAPPVAESVTITAQAPLVEPPAAGTRANARKASFSDSISLTARAEADMLSFAPHKTLFGISIDPAAFARVKKVIESGEKPAANAIDVDALVNYFAGEPTLPRGDIAIDVEASRGPVGPKQNSAILRYSIDTQDATDIARRPASPPVATNVILQIEINPKFVSSFRVVGAGKELTVKEPVLLRNASVTGLVEVTPKPKVPRRQVIATIRFRYRDVATGDDHIVVKRVRARDLDQAWIDSSRRHRLATLGAVWGESLQGSALAADVAKTAEELATEVPGDTLARDLAAAASASSRLQNSAPTGSGR